MWCENIFGVFEIVGVKEGKEKEREIGEVVC